MLHYQPIVSLRDGRVSHYEALVRLADEPDGRLVAPGSVPAGRRALRADPRRSTGWCSSKVARLAGRAGTASRRWRIAVNLSALSVTDAGMLAAHRARCLRAARRRPVAARDRADRDRGDLRHGPRERPSAPGCRRSAARSRSTTSARASAPSSTSSTCRSRYLKIDGDFIRGLPPRPPISSS